MRDQRLRVVRAAVDGLIESLDAVVRLSRWVDESEPKPEPLVLAAAKLQDRLGAADRMVAAVFHGNTADSAKVAVMCTALKRLDAAFLLYRKTIELPAQKSEAAMALESEVSATAEMMAAAG